ncbi:MAG: hypothetical protein LVQ94_05900 [Thermoplasmatales archaeon]|nr:hypothetical protein [Thermoplasmatales archaeon]
MDKSYDGKTLTVSIDHLDSYPDSVFDNLSNAVERMGFIAFTVKGDPDSIVILDKSPKRKSESTIKFALVGATILSIIYVGYTYVSVFIGGSNFPAILGYSLILYTIPIIAILGSREIGRFVALHKNGMRYQFPVFIPNPLGMGTMGSLNSRSDSFKNRKVMIETGAYSLIFGLFISMFFYIFGALFTISSLHFYSISHSTSSIGSSLISQMFLFAGLPVSSSLTPIGFAGFVGLIITAYNALPLGFLDGGLISSGIFGKNSYILSYVSVVVIVGFAILYPPVLVLAVFALLFGAKGPQPLNNLSHLSISGKSLTVIAFIVLVIGIAPLPLHVPYNTFHLSVPDSDILIYNNSQQEINFNLSLNNTGAVTVFPSFGVTPTVKYDISGISDSVLPGKQSFYQVTIFTGKNLSYGFSNYTIIVKSGSAQSSTSVRILKINVTSAVEFTNIPNRVISVSLSNKQVQPFVVTSYIQNSSIRIMSIGGQNLSFLFFPSNKSSSSAMISSGFQVLSLNLNISPSSSYTFRVEPLTVPDYWYIVAFNSTFSGTYEKIQVVK